VIVQKTDFSAIRMHVLHIHGGMAIGSVTKTHHASWIARCHSPVTAKRDEFLLPNDPRNADRVGDIVLLYSQRLMANKLYLLNGCMHA